MTKAQIKKRIQALSAEIERHNRLYYAEASPEIADYEYDLLMQELQDLQAKHPLVRLLRYWTGWALIWINLPKPSRIKSGWQAWPMLFPYRK